MRPGASVAQAFAVGALAAAFATSAQAQAQATNAELQQQVSALQAQLRAMQEQQQALTQTLGRLQQQLDARPVASAAPPAPPPTATPPAQTALAPPPVAKASSESMGQKLAERYQDGIVIWQTPPDADVPFLLKYNINSQVRYLNTTSGDDTFTDHLGVERGVNLRNDITVNRTMFILGGYIFDPRLRYSSTVWTSAGSNSIVIAGNIGWQFNKAFTLTGGYTGVPGSRSLVNTFPFFQSTDRSMADNFFRPGFTQGIWANGALPYKLNYLAFVGNGLNTLNLSAAKIDEDLMASASVWWEPLGDYGPPGKSRNMYDDYYAAPNLRMRLGTSYTWAREDRFSDLDQSSPENTSMHNSDGVLMFATGAFAPGVTVDNATYRMWAIDLGLKKYGWSLNGQYYFRWIDDFKADGPMPIDSMFDHGFELSAAGFIVPEKVMAYGRGSMVFGEFRDSWEAGVGVKWYFVPTERMWLTAEVMRVVDTPYGGVFTPYTAGLTAWVPMVQAVLAF
ncbi:FlxA-like family protein [Phenylobacterium sp.]|uniref:FlxA-like family protein n=1 Tax=Phenylobacterium sp. TaxID=1871053 RepID=UPI0026011669|nr:FlxA-like family protein [Phenylobacterium sp.]